MRLSFAKRLRKEREQAGLSQTQLARMSNLSGPMISCLERGESAGSEKAVTAVARALGVGLEWLRSGLGNREPDCPDDHATSYNAAPQPFPERIRQLRKEAGLSQKQLAELVGVSKAAVSCWETGVRGVPAGDNLVRLSEALGLDPSEVMRVNGKNAARNEVRLFAAFRALSAERQLEAISLVEALK
jgi:transcriptional regulator with XRE-family HTH domain